MWGEKLTFYDSLIAQNPNFERKGKTVPYTSANGYMFSILNKDGEIGIRLPKKMGEEFMKKHQTTRFKSHGSYMRGYVLIPENLFKDLDLLSETLQKAYEYVMSLELK